MKLIQRFYKNGLSRKYNQLYLDHLVQKAEVSQRRESTVTHQHYDGKRRHCIDRTGRYHNEEFQRGPKYWKPQKPQRIPNSIRSYAELTDAINSIAAGDTNRTDYKGVTGINYERLKLAQSWKDKGKEYTLYNIICLRSEEIKEELGFGKARFGKVFHD
ncbi:MAG: hypothetical protein Q8R37_02200 [Nanoarchaeota archaeon]|nr:hypothetical protein [Nanoarchaeota archaeon]